mmetsp:Transcript_12574/g.37399  ORF Transcript_12574/g.37399 Transcript_12574/m.37399 type:complete len:168 (+) Transcript_12574:142-645(+)
MRRLASAAVILAAASALVPAPLTRRPHTRRFASDAADDALDGADEPAPAGANATLYKKEVVKAAEDVKIPVDVYDTTPPRKMVGVFPLSPTVGCGDIIKVSRVERQFDAAKRRSEEIDLDEAYVIKRVQSHMKFSNGEFHLVSKTADATEVNRNSIEKRLRRLMPQS